MKKLIFSSLSLESKDRYIVKFRRYEAHIDRTLYKALHELQRLQAVRHGHKFPVPLAIDIDVSKENM